MTTKSLQGTAPRSPHLSPLHIYLYGHWRPPNVFSANWKWTGTSQMPSNYSQQPRDHWRWATIHDQTYPCAH